MPKVSRGVRRFADTNSAAVVAVGVTDQLMDMGNLVEIMDAMEEPAKARGPHKKKAA
jgi:hypothetical protein